MNRKGDDRRRDLRRRSAVDIALALAELNAAWGDYPRALEHMSAAAQLAGGSFEQRHRDERAGWRRAAAVRRDGDGRGRGRISGRLEPVAGA